MPIYICYSEREFDPNSDSDVLVPENIVGLYTRELAQGMWIYPSTTNTMYFFHYVGDSSKEALKVHQQVLDQYNITPSKDIIM